MSVCGVILSGGQSSRMGTNKALLEIRGKTTIENIAAELKGISDQRAVVTNQPEDYSFLNLPLICDRYKNKGPLAGIETALYHIDASIFLIAACDMPFIDSSIYQYLYNQLLDYDAVVPYFNNQLHPLSGIYRKDVLPEIQTQLEKDELRVKSFFNKINVNYVENFAGITEKQLEQHFFNMNNPKQYQEAKEY